MKANIEVNFIKIAGKTVTKEMVEKEPRIKKVADKTVKKICDTLKRYLKEHNIDSSIKHEIIIN